MIVTRGQSRTSFCVFALYLRIFVPLFANLFDCLFTFYYGILAPLLAYLLSNEWFEPTSCVYFRGSWLLRSPIPLASRLSAYRPPFRHYPHSVAYSVFVALITTWILMNRMMSSALCAARPKETRPICTRNKRCRPTRPSAAVTSSARPASSEK